MLVELLKLILLPKQSKKPTKQQLPILFPLAKAASI
jgi:hypothetical protein